MGLRPAEFWTLTPAEFSGIVDGFARRRRNEEEESWRRAAFLGAIFINLSFPFSKKSVKPEDLISFLDEEKREKQEKEAELSDEERQRQMRERLKFFKSKFWTKLDGDSLDKIKVYGE